MGPDRVFEKTAEETRKMADLLGCAACKQPSTELQHLGTVCKHTYCWDCINKLNKVRDPMCNICFSPLEPTRPTTATFMNNLAAGLEKWATLLNEVQLAARREGPAFSIDASTQRMIMETRDPPRRTVDEFLATQNIFPPNNGETTPLPSPRKSRPSSRMKLRSASKTPKGNRSRTVSGCSSISIELDDFADEKPTVKEEVVEEEEQKPDLSELRDIKPEPVEEVEPKPILPRKTDFPTWGSKAYSMMPILFMTQEVGIQEEQVDTTPARPMSIAPRAATKRPYDFTKVPKNVFNGKENGFKPSPAKERPCSSKEKYARDELSDSSVEDSQKKESPKKEKEERTSILPKKSGDLMTPMRTNGVEPELNFLTLERGAPRKSLIHRTGDKPVVAAVLEGDVEKLRKLCAEDVEVNEIDPEHGTPLFVAANKGNLEMCAILVEAGAVINAHCGAECNTALHVAVKNEFEKVAEYLMSKGASRQLRNIRNQTPFEMAQSMSPIRKLVEKYKKYPRQLPIPPKLPKRIIMCVDEEARKQVPVRILERVQRYFEVEPELTTESTHCAVSVDEEGTADGSNQTLITAMLRGLKVVRLKYLEDCIRAGEAIADWLPYEVGRIRFREFPVAEGSVMRCRRAKERFEPGLFKGCIFHLYSTKFSTFGKRTFLCNLILLMEGEVVNKEPTINHEDPIPFHKPTLASPYFILYEQGTKIPSRILDEPKYHMVTPGWLFECITSYEFKNPY